ncbi:MAG: class I SAM-dependent methyltransferase [Thermodesulfobacteriota bacterium]
MEKQAYDKLYEVEKKHWYHDACRKLVDIYLTYIREELPYDLNILDVGCGTGGMLGVLHKYGNVTGLEVSRYAINLCKKKHPGIDLIQGSANDLKMLFKEETFDIIAFFNVLYHKNIENDFSILKDAYTILKPSGYIILYEPAFKCLYRQNDRICHGVRRYSRDDIRRMMDVAGFNLVANTYFNATSFFPVLMLKWTEGFKNINKEKEVVELKLPAMIVNLLLMKIMSFERLWIRLFKKIPFGTSVLYVGRKI